MAVTTQPSLDFANRTHAKSPRAALRTNFILGALAAVLLAAPVAVAAPAAKPKLTGMWIYEPELGPQGPRPRPSLTAEAQAKVDAAAKRAATGLVQNERAVKCLPVGMPIIMTGNFALEFVESDDRILVLAENNSVPRHIYMKQAKHPDYIDPSWNGHSIGHWEADTLVVDTIGFNDRFAAIGLGGAERTKNLHVKERLHMESGGKVLVNQITYEDPTTFTQPYTATVYYRRLEEGSEFMEYVCEVDRDVLNAFFKETGR